MTIDNFFQVLILLTGIVGQLLVAHQNRKGFYWFIACNIVSIIVAVATNLFGMALLYVFYTVMCVYSLYKWKQIAVKTVPVS